VIVCKSPAELERMHASSQLVAQVLEALRPLVVPGATTAEIDREAEALVRAAGALPAFKGYGGYTATVCASTNYAVIHGITSSRKLREGDILSLDMGVKLNGYYGDSAVTIPVGHISPEAERLLRVTQEALAQGIAVVKVGARVSDIGHAVQKYVEANVFCEKNVPPLSAWTHQRCLLIMHKK
jgi:methionyl aminopeptidase